MRNSQQGHERTIRDKKKEEVDYVYLFYEFLNKKIGLYAVGVHAANRNKDLHRKGDKDSVYNKDMNQCILTFNVISVYILDSSFTRCSKSWNLAHVGQSDNKDKSAEQNQDIADFYKRKGEIILKYRCTNV